MYSFTVKGLLQLMRLLEWSKSLGNMVLASVLASMYLDCGISFTLACEPVTWNAFTLLYGFISVGLLWSGLYTLNDYTDRTHDALHSVKKSRAIPSGQVSPDFALFFSVALIVISFVIGFTINPLFLLCLALMLVNQLLYTLKPFQFKKRPIVDLVSGSMINPIFRFYAGWVLFVPAFNAPWLMILFVVLLQFGGYTLYRLASHAHDEKLDYKSTSVVFGEKPVRITAYLGLVIGIISFFLMLASNFFPLISPWGFLPLKFSWLAVGSLALLPLYWHALHKPHEMDLKKMYNLVYVHYSLFILGFIALYYLQI